MRTGKVLISGNMALVTRRGAVLFIILVMGETVISAWGLHPPTEVEAIPLSPTEIFTSWCPSEEDVYYAPPARCTVLEDSSQHTQGNTSNSVSSYLDIDVNHPTVLYTVVCKAVSDIFTYEVDVPGLVVVLRDLLPNTNYEVYVIASNYDGEMSESEHVVNATGDFLLKKVSDLRAYQKESDMRLTWEWTEPTGLFAEARFKVAWDGSVSETHHRFYTIEDYPTSAQFNVCVNAIIDGDWSKESCVDHYYVPPSDVALALTLGIGLPGVLLLIAIISFIVMKVRGKIRPS